MSPPTHYRTDAKQAAIDQWTSDPCEVVPGEVGTAQYFARVRAKRTAYVETGATGDWMSEALDYDGSRGLRVLDVGCGQGIDLVRYAQAGASAVGVDLTPRHVDLARQHLAAMGLDAEVVLEDAERLPFSDGEFDRVSSNGVLHHTPDMSAALRELRRVIKPSGRAAVIVYHRDSTYFWFSILLREGVLRRRLLRESVTDILADQVEFSSIGARPLVRVYSRSQLRKMMHEAGFKDVQIRVRHDSDAFLIRHICRGRLRKVLANLAGWYVIAVARP